MNEVEEEIFREYDLRGLFEEARRRVLDKYTRGEITEEELHEKLGNVVENAETAKQLEKDIMSMKAKKLEEAEEQYANDEITEEELEERMDELFENGDDFLDEDLDEQRKAEIRADRREEILFRLKEIGQIVGFMLVAALVFAAIVVTKGKALLAILPIVIIGWLVYSAMADLF